VAHDGAIPGSEKRAPLIEELALGRVPEDQRHGKSSGLFYVWFACSLSIATLVIGALAVYMGNNLFWATMAVFVGNAIGALFMAAHSAQGPILGVPQLIQSRGQFGYYLGAWLPVVLSLIMFIGFWAFGAVAAAGCVVELGDGLSARRTIIVMGVVTVVIAVLGYRVIHWTQRITTYVGAFALLVLSVATLTHGGLNWSTDGFTPGPWFLTVALIAVYQISFGPYVSDYSRYLPRSIGLARPFWWTYAGTTIAATWVMALGVFITVQFPDLSPAQAVGAVVTGRAWAAFVLLALAAAVIGMNAMNLYGGMLAVFTGASCFFQLDKGAGLRVAGILGVFVVAISVALASTADFLANYQNFLALLAYIFIPWSTINLIDFYVLKRGQYDVAAFFDRHGIYTNDPPRRTYWGVNLDAAVAYSIGVAVELPFMVTTYYTGWWVDDLGGADIAWLMGLIVPAVAFYLLARVRASSATSVSDDGGEQRRDDSILSGVADQSEASGH
jgi:purine-cytosine permease-like protein